MNTSDQSTPDNGKEHAATGDSTVLKLNQIHDYALAHIYGYLSLNDRLNLRAVHSRFRDFSQSKMAWDNTHLKIPFSLSDEDLCRKLEVIKKVSSVNMCATLNKSSQIDVLLKTFHRSLTIMRLTVPNVEMIFKVLSCEALTSLTLVFPIVDPEESWETFPGVYSPLTSMEIFGYVPCTFAIFLEKFKLTLKEVTFHPTMTVNCVHRRAIELLPNVNYCIILKGHFMSQTVHNKYVEITTLHPNTNITYINIPDQDNSFIQNAMQL